jgi:signal transduction histidine kinase/CheY-like chemotaxis protein
MRKNVFRITSLLNLFTAAIFLLTSAAAVTLVFRNGRQQALAEAEAKTHILLERNLATHTYFNHQLRPAIIELDAAGPEYFNPIFMSSTYAVREIDEIFKGLSDEKYYYKEAAINARNPLNEADPFEVEFLSHLNADPTLKSLQEVREIGGEPLFIVLRRGETMEQSCLVCHSDASEAPKMIVQLYGPDRSFGRHVGEVVSAISIRIPLAAAYTRTTRLTVKLSILLFLVINGFFLVQYFLYRKYLFGPLTTVRLGALNISSEHAALGSEIELPIGRELRELAVSFNTMSGKLKDGRDQLESRIERRTQELTIANQRLAEELTFREKAEPELMKAQKLESLGVLAGGIAHDFNNLLSAIMGNASLARMLDNPDDQVECLDEVENACRRAKALSEQLLTFSKGGSPVRKTIEVAKLIHESVTLALRGTATSGRFLLPEDLWCVHGDEDQLHQVIHNISINAVQAMANGGAFEVTCENTHIGPESEIPLTPGPHIRMAFTDSGPGITANNLPRIFDPYFTTKGGNGLGLATAFSIIQRHGGHMQAISDGSRGTTMLIHLPARPDAELEKVPASHSATSEARGKRVLVLDDEDAIRKLLSRALTARGFPVVVTPEGQAAVDEFRSAAENRKPFDYVLLDLNIPGGMGGHEAFLAMKEIDPKVIGFISSGYSDSPVMADFEKIGLAGVVKKPYSVNELIDVFLAQGAP